MSPKQKFEEAGFLIINNIYNTEEIIAITRTIEEADSSKHNFRKSTGLYAIRQFLQEIPAIQPLIFTPKLHRVITEIIGPHYFVVKSIYFDKPENSNWYVAYHQDLTISVDKKEQQEGFTNWTNKQNQFAVQPPIAILKNIVTVRIHLDDTDENNGALKIIPGSHAKKIYRPENIDRTTEQETFCPVNTGGIMLMKPLTLHSSNRTTNNKKRRVIHIEFSSQALPGNLQWSEKTATQFFRH